LDNWNISEGHKLWSRATRCIPGGNGLLSKRPERYLPDLWPTYFKSSNGVEVISLDGIKYVDMAQMGLGSSILGYAHPELNDAVCTAIGKGVNCSLNAPEEVYLAEKLIELNPFAGGVRFARTGGEAMAIAVRIARAYTGRSKVAFSGYHGWCDWYLAANMQGEDSLAPHLLPGLAPKGVPEGLKGTAIPFLYNNVKDLERVVQENPDLGVICIEGARHDFPAGEFLDSIQNYARTMNLVVILDEITSGWRMTDGGVYKLNAFQPDMVVYAKGMGGGFAISAVLGKQDVMDIAQDTFLSSTMWTERVGFVAGLKTIEILCREKGWNHLIAMGTKIGKGWSCLARKHGLEIEVSDFKPLVTMKFQDEKNKIGMQTLFTQEMLERGYLAAGSVYVSMAHTQEIINTYLNNVDQVFAVLAEALHQGDLMRRLKTRPKSDAFQRLT
jgi:glutamate-1-semialdehyde 2,1-aminomutase